jgi:hypothetical protein
MKRSFGALLILVFVSACGGGGDIGAIERPPPSVPPPTASEQLAADLAGLNLTDFYDVSYEALIYREPESIAWNKLESVYPVEFPILDDLRDAHKRETLAMVQVALDALQGYVTSISSTTISSQPIILLASITILNGCLRTFSHLRQPRMPRITCSGSTMSS